MDLKEIFNFELIATKDFTLTVYHLFIVALILLATRLLLFSIQNIMARQAQKKDIEFGIEHVDILSRPEPFVKFNDFGNSSLDFQLLFWTYKTFEVEKIKSDLRFMIDQRFRENNIRIPFPQRDVHIIPPGE